MHQHYWALLQNEPGAHQVRSVFHKARISTVNWSEVIQKLQQHDPNAADIRPDLELAGLEIVVFDANQAIACASLWEPGKGLGLSLADRACLQLGLTDKQAILTCDLVWKKLDLPGLAVEIIR